MLKQLILENWKSFRYAELPLDPLTVLIGTNASGKSNVVEALEFLQRIAQGENIETALAGNKTLSSLRGGVEWAAHKPENEFTLKVLVAGEDETTDHLYVIQIQTIPKIRIMQESIEYIDEKCHPHSVLFCNGIYHSSVSSLDWHIPHLKTIFILNPIPSKMRDYSRLSDRLESDAANIAGVLAALPEQEKTEVESTLSNYIKDLPEGDIKKVWAEKVGRLGIDAMLYCEEEWKTGEITEIDARSMSDGTLRFLAIITALLTRPKGSQIVIEEIDNGLHPSRAKLLVKILREIGSKRNIDILITTHNPALIDAFGPEIVPFVVVAHRDSKTGESKLSILEDIENLPLLLASGTLGKLATKGAIEKSLADHNKTT